MPIFYNAQVGSNFSQTGDGFQVFLARMTPGNHRGTSGTATPSEVAESLTHKLFNVIPDMVITVGFFMFYLYWSKKSEIIVSEIKKEVRLPSYKTLELT